MTMNKFHAVMRGECGEEFGVDLDAETRDDAYDQLDEDYPESRCVQLESPADTAKREAKIYADINAGIDYDDDGRPFYHAGEGGQYGY
jgi:hypothetical protein